MTTGSPTKGAGQGRTAKRRCARMATMTVARAPLGAAAAAFLFLAVCHSASAFSAVVTASASNQAGDGYGTGAAWHPLVSSADEKDVIKFHAIPTNLDQVNECKVEGPFTFSWHGIVNRLSGPATETAQVMVPLGPEMVTEKCTVTGRYDPGQQCKGRASATGKITVYLVGLTRAKGAMTPILAPHVAEGNPPPAALRRFNNVITVRVSPFICTGEVPGIIYVKESGYVSTINSFVRGPMIGMYPASQPGAAVSAPGDGPDIDPFIYHAEPGKRFAIQLWTPIWRITKCETKKAYSFVSRTGPWIPETPRARVTDVAFSGAAFAVWGKCCGGKG